MRTQPGVGDPILDRAWLDRPLRFWTAATVSDKSLWRRGVHETVVSDLMEETSSEGGVGGSSAAQPCKGTRAMLGEVLGMLEAGVGFVVLNGLCPPGMSLPAAHRLLLRLGQRLGAPLAQDRRGRLVWDLIDTDPPISKDDIGTRAEDLPFHNDNAWGEVFPDYVGMLCIEPAAIGGVLQITSALSVLSELEAYRPGSLKILREPCRYDFGRQMVPGDAARASMPILQDSGSDVSFRYLRYQIDEPSLHQHQRDTITALEEVLGRAELHFEHSLVRGDLCLINNHWLLHRRARYRNGAAPRHHLRLWIQKGKEAV